MSGGSVSFVGDITRRIPIKIYEIRELLKSSLQCGSNLVMGDFVVIQGVSSEFFSVPLH